MRMRSVTAVLAAVGVALGLASAGAAPPRDYAAVALNVLVPGENGSVSFNRNTNDQVKLYDGLTPLRDEVAARDLTRYFKPAGFGPGSAKPTRVESVGRGDVRVVRDRFGVAHVTAKKRAALMYAAGWVTAEDRGLLMDLLRNAGRLSAIDAPGFNAFAVALSGRTFVPSAQTEKSIASQLDLLEKAGPDGRQVLADMSTFLDGINSYYEEKGLPVAAWTPSDVAAVATVLAARFAADGGDEARRSEFLAELQRRLGPAKGRAVFDDLSELDDPDAPVTAPGTFPYEPRARNAPGSVVLAPGSFLPAGGPSPGASAYRSAMSNALLIGAKRSATGHPLLVAGPQLGYFFPEVFLELDLHGDGIDVRGGTVPGVPYVIIGRGRDYAWSATSPQSDNIDSFAETLCGGDDVHYLYKGECRAMTTFDAGVLKGAPGKPDTPVVFRETVHGPVIGYATTVEGRRVAISQARSTRGRELLSLLPLKDLSENRVTNARGFIRTMNRFELTLNWFYADDRDIAFFSSGRLPIRAAGIDPSLPTAGTGAYEWRGFLSEKAHPQAIDPPAGVIVNWNNKQARGFGTADANWAYGSVQRVDLLVRGIEPRRKHTLASVAAAMNEAATEDLRAVRVLPTIAAVLKTGPAPSQRAETMLGLLDRWAAAGASRLDRDLDGRIDDPGAAILDAVWARWADAVMSPVLGPLVDRLAELMPRDDAPGPEGSAYLYGWYGYVEKDLRALLGEPVKAPFATRFCGAGDLAACRASLWAALEAAGAELAATQGSDPAGWRADATRERIRFAPGILPDTMRWANRSTFQQVMTFNGHRPR